MGFLSGIDIFAKGDLKSALKPFYQQMSNLVSEFDFGDEEKLLMFVNVDLEIAKQFQEEVVNDDDVKDSLVYLGLDAKFGSGPHTGIAVKCLNSYSN